MLLRRSWREIWEFSVLAALPLSVATYYTNPQRMSKRFSLKPFPPNTHVLGTTRLPGCICGHVVCARQQLLNSHRKCNCTPPLWVYAHTLITVKITSLFASHYLSHSRVWQTTGSSQLLWTGYKRDYLPCALANGDFCIVAVVLCVCVRVHTWGVCQRHITLEKSRHFSEMPRDSTLISCYCEFYEINSALKFSVCGLNAR